MRIKPRAGAASQAQKRDDGDESTTRRARLDGETAGSQTQRLAWRRADGVAPSSDAA